MVIFLKNFWCLKYIINLIINMNITSFHLQDMQLDLGLPCGVFPEKCVSLDKLNVILLRHSDIQDTL